MLRKFFNSLLLSYEERLKPAERELYDHFCAARDQGHQALVVFKQPVTGKVSYFGIPEGVPAKEYVAGTIRKEGCGDLILALDLKQDFRSQWCRQPGHVESLDFLARHPLLRVPDLYSFTKVPAIKRNP